MQFEAKRALHTFALALLTMLLLTGGIWATTSGTALAASDSLEITGDGVKNPLVLSLDQLRQMPQYQYVYSAVNTWPTKKWYVGEGVRLQDLLDRAGITDKARLLKFTSADGYTVSVTVQELCDDKRYRFPYFKAGLDADGHLPGDPAEKAEVGPIVSLISVEGSDNPAYMNDLNTLLLMLGQRTVTEQTGNLFVKYLHKIEVLTTEPEKWDAPRANPAGGVIPAGAMVALSNIHGDDDKIHYTTDGSTPTMDSPVYNWIASRWWTARADVLGAINHPIGPINQDTTIKAVTIGPGKLDSDIAVFQYQIAGQSPAGPSLLVKLTVGVKEASVNGRPYILEAEPYINAAAGRTLVPVRFVSEALGAEVGWNPESRQVPITYADKAIILTVDSAVVEVNGEKQTIDCAPAILPPGRTFVPLRFISETLEAEVVYDPGTGQILITR